MYIHIVNPLTNKKISIFSKNGKKVLKNFIYQLQFGGDCEGTKALIQQKPIVSYSKCYNESRKKKKLYSPTRSKTGVDIKFTETNRGEWGYCAESNNDAERIHNNNLYCAGGQIKPYLRSGTNPSVTTNSTNPAGKVYHAESRCVTGKCR